MTSFRQDVEEALRVDQHMTDIGRFKINPNSLQIASASYDRSANAITSGVSMEHETRLDFYDL